MRKLRYGEAKRLVAEPVSDKARIQTQMVWAQNPCTWAPRSGSGSEPFPVVQSQGSEVKASFLQPQFLKAL